MGWRGVGGVVAVAALLAGCGSRSAADDPAGAGGDLAGSVSSQARSLTQTLLARYEKSLPSTAPGLVDVTSDLVSQVGEWEPKVGENNKIAVLTGHVQELPSAAPGAGHSVIRWADGRSVAVRTISARQAVATLRDAAVQQSCDGCTPVILSDPRLTQRAVQTSSGNATVPAWSFAVRGSRVRVTVVAVDTAALVPALPEVTAPRGPFVATRHAVAILIREFAHQDPVGRACSAVGYLRTTSVHLSAPLAGRAVLDVVHGQPVPLH